ncbi:transposase [Yersinia enterocolitica]|uniref:transposase n=1 Tax=Yersinia enterocolitica TaxID=630 RepID=UPI003B8F8DE1
MTLHRGQALYSDLVIQTCLMLRTVLRISQRQTEGLIAKGTTGLPGQRGVW